MMMIMMMLMIMMTWQCCMWAHDDEDDNHDDNDDINVLYVGALSPFLGRLASLPLSMEETSLTAVLI